MIMILEFISSSRDYFVTDFLDIQLEAVKYIEPENGFDPPEENITSGNLTQYVDTSYGGEHDGDLTKAIYKLSAMLELGIHGSTEFLHCKQFRHSGSHRSEGYMAHIKKTRLKTKVQPK